MSRVDDGPRLMVGAVPVPSWCRSRALRAAAAAAAAAPRSSAAVYMVQATRVVYRQLSTMQRPAASCWRALKKGEQGGRSAPPAPPSPHELPLTRPGHQFQDGRRSAEKYSSGVTTCMPPEWRAGWQNVRRFAVLASDRGMKPCALSLRRTRVVLQSHFRGAHAHKTQHACGSSHTRRRKT